MSHSVSHSAKSPDVERVEELAHTSVTNCYQCGKCSAGCPMGDQMDILPSTLIRLVQIGEVKEAASANAVWKCLACLTCTTRCPKEVDIAGVMDALKQISLEKDCVHKDMKEIVLFQKTFLNTIRRNGRTNELELVAEYKIRGFLGNFNPFWALKDSSLGPAMLAKGKLHIGIGSPVKDKSLVKRIFDKCLKEEQQ
jgi:heterodisulfide reductase subunit C